MDFDKEFDRLSKDKSLLLQSATIKNLMNETKKMMDTAQMGEQEIDIRKRETTKYIKEAEEVSLRLNEFGKVLQGKKLNIKNLTSSIIDSANPVFLKEKLNVFEIENLKERYNNTKEKKQKLSHDLSEQSEEIIVLKGELQAKESQLFSFQTMESDQSQLREEKEK